MEKTHASDIRFVIITGMSGAGKSVAVNAFEDLGYFCVDNLPPTLIPKFAELCLGPQGDLKRVALVIDVRGGEFFPSTFEALEGLERIGLVYRILFLEAGEEALVRRFKETRRRHPLAPQGRVLEGIREERRRLEELRGRAHRVIDTGSTSPQELRDQILRDFGQDRELKRLLVSVVSFGFKHGLPLDSDLVFDVRFLPNPQYVESLRDLDGRDAQVQDYIFKWPLPLRFSRRLANFILYLLPHYTSEGKTQLTIAVGCTGGQHRSVAVAARLADVLRRRGYPVVVEHRELSRDEPLSAGKGGQ